LESVAGIAGENSASTGQVSASAVEINSQLQKMTESSNMLLNTAAVLKEKVASQKV
jgi:hypothetical protein